MKRNLDLIRYLLLSVESSTELPVFSGDLVNADYSHEEISYHILLLDDSSFIESSTYKVIKHSPFYSFHIYRLTNQGHDFLDTIRDNKIFTETKNKILSTVGSAALEIVKDVAVNITKGYLNI